MWILKFIIYTGLMVVFLYSIILVIRIRRTLTRRKIIDDNVRKISAAKTDIEVVLNNVSKEDAAEYRTQLKRYGCVWVHYDPVGKKLTLGKSLN